MSENEDGKGKVTSDTGKKLEAIQNELHDLSREFRNTPPVAHAAVLQETPTPLDKRIDERADSKVKDHVIGCQKDNWSDSGTFGKFREEVRRDLATLKSYTRALVIASTILALMNAWATWTSKINPAPSVVPSAQAYQTPAAPK